MNYVPSLEKTCLIMGCKICDDELIKLEFTIIKYVNASNLMKYYISIYCALRYYEQRYDLNQGKFTTLS